MLLSELYENSIYSDNGINFDVIKAGKNQRDKHKLECIVCREVCIVTASSVLSGRLPCLCSPKANTTPERKMKRLLEQANVKNLTILQDFVENAKSPVACKCNVCQKIWNSTYNSIVLKGSGCPSCNNSEKLSLEHAAERLKEKLSPSLRILKFDYKYFGSTSKSKITMSCDSCENIWETSYASLSGGRGCPACAKFGFQKDKPAVLYILRVISEDNLLIGYKFGITCDLHRRIVQHNKLCKSLGIKFEDSRTWNYNNGSLAAAHEKILKEHFGNYFTKDQLPSGFSESISIANFSEFLDIQNNLYSESLEWLHTE